MKMRLRTVIAVAVLAAAASGSAVAMLARPVAVAPTAAGITVHGRWTIRVYDHGRLVRERRFENALTSAGKLSLANVLGGQRTPGSWGLLLWDADLPPAAEKTILHAYESGPGQLGVGFLPVNGGPKLLRLTLNAPALRSGTITNVMTSWETCPPTTPTSNCNNYSDQLEFTQRVLSPGIPVLGGQNVSVGVTISFS